MNHLCISITALFLGFATAIVIADDLEAPSSWEFSSPDTLSADFNEWIDTLALEKQPLDQIRAIVAELNDNNSRSNMEKALLEATAIAMNEHAPAIKGAVQGKALSLADIEAISLDELPPVVSNNLKVAFGKSLSLGQLYDEAKQMFSEVDLTQVADPAAYLFYSSVCHYRLREKDESLEALDKLLERKDELPERYANLATLMRLDIQALEPDTLDEVARIMDSIKVRLGHGHAGTRVRKEEQDVVDKLDKMIEDLEEQLRQLQAMAGGAAQGLQSNSPAQDSSLPGGNAQGDVGRQALGDKTEWGNLPPKEREESLQQLGKEFPSHYREIIEEYFRKLAQDEARDE